MSTSTVQRQSIVSILITYLGFGFGALNLLVLQNLIISRSQFGLTRVITDAGLLAATFATMGSTAIVSKFFTFHKRHLTPQQNDLPFVATVLAGLGMVFTTLLLLIGKPALVYVFGKRNALFEPYYYLLIPFFLCFTAYMVLEPFAWYAKRTVAANFMKELLFRALTTLLFVLLGWGIISFQGFMYGFAFIYLLPAILLFIIIRRAGGFPWVTRISSLTRRLSDKMMELGAFVFASLVANIAVMVADTLFLASMYSFEKAGVWAMAQYFATVLEAPARSLSSSAIPMLAEYWRQKNYTGLLSVYRKSCINLLIIGLALGGLIIINIPNLLLFLKNPEYNDLYLPLIILIFSKLINLGTGVNELIIKLSTRWRFDFTSTIIYSLIGIPLNFFLISAYGMTGAALANLLAMLVYNGLRFWFLYKQFGLQPFDRRFAELLVASALLITGIALLPHSGHWLVDVLWRSAIFVACYVALLLGRSYSHEVNWLWKKWVVNRGKSTVEQNEQ